MFKGTKFCEAHSIDNSGAQIAGMGSRLSGLEGRRKRERRRTVNPHPPPMDSTYRGIFITLLSDKGINHLHTWEEAIELIEDDVRFHMLCPTHQAGADLQLVQKRPRREKEIKE